MDFTKPFTFAFDDPEWITKILITSLIGLIPIVGQFYLVGWMLEIARQVANGTEPLRLPEIDFGLYLGDGFKAAVLGLVYGLPIFILIAPVVIVPILGEAINMGEDVMVTLSMITSVCCSGVILIYSIFLGLAMPAAQVHMVMKNSLGAGLRFKEVFSLVRAAPTAYLMVLVGNIVAGLLAGIVGGIACGIGIIVTMTYYQAVIGHLSGQAYRQAQHAVTPTY